jgi:hypothetical protein
MLVNRSGVERLAWLSSGAVNVDVPKAHAQLVATLKVFFEGAAARSPEFTNFSDREVATLLSRTPGAASIQEAARSVAAAHGYPRQRSDRTRHSRAMKPESKFAGRRFDAAALYQLGVAAALRGSHGIDLDTLSAQLAAYLAGPNIDLERLIVIDGDFDQLVPMHLLGWHLHCVDPHELSQLRPVPSVADYAPSQRWDPLLTFGWNWVLRKVDSNEVARTGIGPFPESIFRYVEARVEGWQPLFLCLICTQRSQYSQ